MKEFNLELAKAGHPVQTRDGRKARIICWDAKCVNYPIIALVENPDSGEHPDCYTTDGYYSHDEDGSENDLVMATEKHEGWLNLYKNAVGVYPGQNVYKTKEEAESAEHEKERVATIKIEWEE